MESNQERKDYLSSLAIRLQKAKSKNQAYQEVINDICLDLTSKFEEKAEEIKNRNPMTSDVIDKVLTLKEKLVKDVYNVNMQFEGAD